MVSLRRNSDFTSAPELSEVGRGVSLSGVFVGVESGYEVNVDRDIKEKKFFLILTNSSHRNNIRYM